MKEKEIGDLLSKDKLISLYISFSTGFHFLILTLEIDIELPRRASRRGRVVC